MELLIGLAALEAIVYALKVHLRRKRRAALFLKYGDMFAVDDIMAKLIWQGMSDEQLIDSGG